MKKRTWRKPKLLVLVRGSQGETALQTCKTETDGGPDYGPARCRDAIVWCYWCQWNTTS